MLLRKKGHLAKFVQPLRGLRGATDAASGRNWPMNDTFGAALPAPRGDRPRHGWGSAGQAGIQASGDAAVAPKMAPASSSCPGRRAFQSNGSRTTTTHMGGPPVHQGTAHLQGMKILLVRDSSTKQYRLRRSCACG